MYSISLACVRVCVCACVRRVSRVAKVRIHAHAIVCMGEYEWRGIDLGDDGWHLIGLYSDGRCSYSLYGYDLGDDEWHLVSLYSDGRCSCGRNSYGRCSHGRNSYGLGDDEWHLIAVEEQLAQLLQELDLAVQPPQPVYRHVCKRV